MRYLVLIGIVLMFLCNVVSANHYDHEIEWENKYVNFKEINNVYINMQPIIYDGIVIDDMDKMRLDSIIYEQQKKYLKKYNKVTSPEQADVFVDISIVDWRQAEEYQHKWTYIDSVRDIQYENEDGKQIYVDYPVPEIIGGDMQYPWYLTVKYSVTDRDDNLLYIYMFESKEETQTNVDIFENTTQDFFKKFNRLK